MKKFLKLVFGVVLPGVFEAEANNGSGKGEEKLKEVLDKVTKVPFSLPEDLDIEEVAGDVKELVNAVVDVLNALGVLDDEPGIDVDLADLIPAVVRFARAAQAVLDLFDGEE